MRLLLPLLLLVTACPARPRAASPDLSSADELDGMGRAMTAPLRVEMMRPQALIARIGASDDAVVADIGAGPGVFSHAWSRAVPRGRVIATEISRAYLARILRDAARSNEHNVETRFVEPDATGLKDAEIDVAFLCQVDHYLRDRRSYLFGLVRALRPKGRIIIVNYQRERPAIVALAQELSWTIDDQWEPAPGFYAISFRVD